MLRRSALLILALVFSIQACGGLSAAGSQEPPLLTLGPYQLVNTAGFSIAEDGRTQEMPKDLGSIEMFVDLTTDRSAMILGFDTMRLTLPRVPRGLAGVDWVSNSAITLRREDILTLTGKELLEDIEAYGAKIEWPGAGPSTLVLFEAGGSSFAGFLVSRPGGRVIVRQMEAHRYFASRPRAARSQ